MCRCGTQGELILLHDGPPSRDVVPGVVQCSHHYRTEQSYDAGVASCFSKQQHQEAVIESAVPLISFGSISPRVVQRDSPGPEMASQRHGVPPAVIEARALA
jgi:hypothetical protein